MSANWNAATDNGSGIGGYSLIWDTSQATIPSANNTAANVTASSSGALADGTYYFHIRAIDNIANWGTTMTAGPFLIERVPPSAPATSVNSPSHILQTWSNLTAISINWTAAVDSTSGIGGYSIICDNVSDTLPPQTKTTENVTSTSVTAPFDGTNIYVHIRAVDRAGNWSAEAAHLGPFWIETVAPTGPSDINISHPVATLVIKQHGHS